MNHDLWNRVGTRVAALVFVIASAAACGEKLSDVSSGGPSANPVSPSAQVIGVAPAEPKAEPAGTVPTVPSGKELTKSQESKAMPMEGQDSSHMTEARKDSQRAGGSDAQTERRPQ